MFIRYNEINKYYEYDTSGGSGVGPWLILPIDYAQIYNPPIIVPPDPLPPNIAFTDVANIFGPIQTLNGGLTVNSNARASGFIRSDTAFYERLRPVAIGHWQDVPFNAANFGANAPGTWTVGSAAIVMNRFTIIGLTMHWSLYISWFSGGNVIGGSPNVLYISIPGGFIAPGNMILQTGYATDGARVELDAGPGNNMSFNKRDSSPFTTGGAVGLIGTFTFEILGAGVNVDV